MAGASLSNHRLRGAVRFLSSGAQESNKWFSVADTPSTYPTCPSCGSASFYVDGFLSYRQRYDADCDAWATSKIDWDNDSPVRANCSKCEADVSQLLQQRGIISLYDVDVRLRH